MQMYFATYSRLRLHVSASDTEVVRAARRVLKMELCLGTRGLRQARHRFYRAILKQHHAEQALFRRYRF